MPDPGTFFEKIAAGESDAGTGACGPAPVPTKESEKGTETNGPAPVPIKENYVGTVFAKFCLVPLLLQKYSYKIKKNIYI